MLLNHQIKKIKKFNLLNYCSNPSTIASWNKINDLTFEDALNQVMKMLSDIWRYQIVTVRTFVFYLEYWAVNDIFFSIFGFWFFIFIIIIFYFLIYREKSPMCLYTSFSKVRSKRRLEIVNRYTHNILYRYTHLALFPFTRKLFTDFV